MARTSTRSAAMKRFIALLVVGLMPAALSAHAALSVFATVPEWGALVQELGGDKVKVYVATSALQDPHHVEARPSLIARARSAELVVATGAELEVGWLGMHEIAAIEPKPGIEPTTAHLSDVLATLQRSPARMVLRAAYQSEQASQWLAQRTKINVVTLPFTVGGTDRAKDLYSMFD